MATTSKLLDDTGWAIIDELQKDARKSLREIGKKVGLTAPAVMERIRRLEEEEIIEGYRAVINPKKVGYNLKAILALKTKYDWPEDHITQKLEAIPEVINYWSVTGEVEYFIEILLPSIQYLESILRQLSNHGHIVTSVVISNCPQSGKVIPRPDTVNKG